jgi:hypothetical protein
VLVTTVWCRAIPAKTILIFHILLDFVLDLGASNHVINSYTPVRILGDRVETLEVLRYQHIASRAYRGCFVSAPHTRLFNCASSDTVGFTPHICKRNHDGLCGPQMWRAAHALIAGFSTALRRRLVA